ncbi:MAG TPA: VWA domain-containing protein [Thermoanaerobaculia bacterium]|nr:VWA domain-containing protein [Thermoanaerobaculia bacterium]
MRRRRRILSILRACAFLAASAASAGAALPVTPQDGVEPLAERHHTFLEEVALLISEEEREAFLALSKDYQRDQFIEEFWRKRDEYPDTARNETRERWEQRLLEARQLFDGLEDDRSTYLLLNGPADVRVVSHCRGVMVPSEAWFYGFGSESDVLATSFGAQQLRSGQFVALFYRRFGKGVFRIWSPTRGLDVLADALGTTSVSGSPGSQSLVAALQQTATTPLCKRELMAAALGIIRALDRGIAVASSGSSGGDPFAGVHYEKMVASRLEAPKAPGREWVLTFQSYSTDRPEGAPSFDAEVEITYPGRRQSRTLVQGVLLVDLAGVEATELLGRRSWDFELIGEVLRPDAEIPDPAQDPADRLFESFRYRFAVTPDELIDGRAALLFERALRPADYRVVLRLDDLSGGGVFRTELDVSVPATPEPPELDPASLLFRALEAAAPTDRPELLLVEPDRDLITGYQRFEALVRGGIESVEFSIDGRVLGVKRSPPWSLDLDLGSLPRSRILRAVARDAEGAEVAADELEINASPHRFAVRIAEPISGTQARGAIGVRVAPAVPMGETLDRIEILRGDELVATLYQEPWEQAVRLSSDATTAITARAHLADGASAEDTVIVNGPALAETFEVDLVELYTAMVDARGRPLLDVERSAVRVLEDGVEQEIQRFERVDDVPITATLMLDVSASMAPRLERAVAAAVGFFEQVVRPGDRMSVITFNDRPTVSASFSGDPQDLAAGLAGLRAERGTALYDSLIFALFNSNGLSGQRALIVLTDGVDESSRSYFEQAIEFARRSEVAIYPIGVDLSERSARKVLDTFAEETGGRAFYVDEVDELETVYRQIGQELRSKVLIVYQSSATSSDGSFRNIEVEVDRRGARAKTLRGYYP